MNDLLFTRKYILACAQNLLIILLIRTEVSRPNTRKKITVTLLEEYPSIQVHVCNMCGSAHMCMVYHQTGLIGLQIAQDLVKYLKTCCQEHACTICQEIIVQ